jgi:UPF0716 protein FxsA
MDDILMAIVRWLLLSLLLLPVMELAAFIAVAIAIGFGWALGLLVLGSLTGWMLLRHAGFGHIARVRQAMGQGDFTALRADGTGGLVLLSGVLLLVPGFITDAVALVLLIAPLRRVLAEALGLERPPRAPDGVVDLEPEQWRRVPDPQLPDERPHERR